MGVLVLRVIQMAGGVAIGLAALAFWHSIWPHESPRFRVIENESACAYLADGTGACDFSVRRSVCWAARGGLVCERVE